MKNLINTAFALVVFAMVTGCSTMSGHMKVAPEAEPKATDDKALLVFIRPSALGAAVQASLYDVTNDDVEFIGISSYQTKVPYMVEPGEHKFMVVGESADFMKATLEAGKTYYAVVSPRMGFWKARFSFKPIRRTGEGEFTVSSEEFASWLKNGKFVEKQPTADIWFEENKADIRAKRDKYWPAWEGKEASEQQNQTMNADDGI